MLIYLVGTAFGMTIIARFKQMELSDVARKIRDAGTLGGGGGNGESPSSFVRKCYRIIADGYFGMELRESKWHLSSRHNTAVAAAMGALRFFSTGEETRGKMFIHSVSLPCRRRPRSSHIAKSFRTHSAKLQITLFNRSSPQNLEFFLGPQGNPGTRATPFCAPLAAAVTLRFWL